VTNLVAAIPIWKQ